MPRPLGFTVRCDVQSEQEGDGEDPSVEFGGNSYYRAFTVTQESGFHFPEVTRNTSAFLNTAATQ